MIQDEKTLAWSYVNEQLPDYISRLEEIDSRLADYFRDIAYCPTLHNGYEILGALKFLRLLNTYEYDVGFVQQIIRLREGNWQRDERGRWTHISGGINCPGTDTKHVYRWQPFQVFVLANQHQCTLQRYLTE